MGQIYVPVDANTVNGIMTLNASGAIPGGYWLHWSIDGGFINEGWYWYDGSNYVPEWWEINHEKYVNTERTYYANTEEDFKKYLKDYNITTLPLEGWTDKGDFVGKYMTTLGSFEDGGCIEF